MQEMERPIAMPEAGTAPRAGDTTTLQSDGLQAWLMDGLYGLLLLAIIGGTAFVIWLDRDAVALGGGVLLLALVFTAVVVVGYIQSRTRYEAGPTHLVRRPPFGRAEAIAWGDLIAARDNPQARTLVFDSRWGEQIKVHIPLGKSIDEFRRVVQQRLPAHIASQMTNLPGAQPSRRARPLEIATTILFIVGTFGMNLAARNLDWRDLDARCLKESAIGIMEPSMGCLERAAAAHDQAWLDSLLADGADPNRLNKQDELPLHVTIRHGFPDGVSSLLNAGADPLRGLDEGSSPLDFALEQRDYESLANILRRVGKSGERADAQAIAAVAMQGSDKRFRSMVQAELGTLVPRVVDPAIQQRYQDLLQQATTASDARDYGVVIARANEAIDLDPTIDMAYAMSGFGYWQMSNWGRAKARLKKAIELNPGQPGHRQMLANVYQATGDYDLAEKLVSEAFELDSGSVALLVDRAIIRQDAGRLQAALEDAAAACAKRSEIGCEMERSLKLDLKDLKAGAR
jgi:tetratricopeptide (TPR) repeat protein